MARSSSPSSSPSSSHSAPSGLLPRNIVIAGETGVGKSSFINLVANSPIATIGNDACGVTARARCHHWETPSRTHSFHLWDTPGLNEGSFGNVSPREAQGELCALLKRLSKKGGVHLLILCMRGIGHVTKGMHQNYHDVLRIRNMVSPQTPFVAVITELEKRCNKDDIDDIASSMEAWWSDNMKELSKMSFSGHACLTTLTDDCHPPIQGRYATSQRLAQNLLIDHALPYTGPIPISNPSSNLTRNVVVVGQTGGGKSSTINLVIGTDSAIAENSARAVTSSTSYHDWSVFQTQTFRLWDTPGLDQGPVGSTPTKHAHNALRSLLTELSRDAGVHLLILCFPRRVTKSTKQAYGTVMALRDSLCPDTPLVAVVTGLESTFERSIPDAPDIPATMEQWWHASSRSISDHDITFSGHAYITTLADDAHPPMPTRRDECQRLVRNLIIDHALTPRSVPAQDLHVVLFGEAGVGKSSLINLLAGWQIAEVSPDSAACTFQSAEYQFQLGATTVRLWDTVGLEEPEDSTIVGGGYTAAIEKAIELVGRLSASGGISLFLFCTRGNRVTTTMQSNYRLFYEVLGKKQVPIALAVTHLEREQGKMDDWWTRNVEKLEKDGIRVCGHACITALAEHPRYLESRSAVQELLWQYADQGKFVMPSEAWLGRLLNGLIALLGFGFPKGKDLTGILTRRCHLEPDVAQKVAACIANTVGT